MDGKPRELTPEALGKEFSIKLTRAELLVIFNLIQQHEFKIHLRDIGQTNNVITIFNHILEKVDSPVNALTESDFVQPEQPKEEKKEEPVVAEEVVLN